MRPASLAALIALMPAATLAQDLPPAVRGDIMGDIQQQDDELRRQARERRAETTPPVRAAEVAVPGEQFSVPQGGACFTITEVRIEGSERLGPRPEGADGLIGHCATAADIAAALNRITTAYQQQGYITSRAYAPEQDVADGKLLIQVVPGWIEGYVYANGAQADRRIRAAFPDRRGDVLNLRSIEQGLDNINAPRSVTAQFQLVPGESPGGSFIAIEEQQGKPWQLQLGVDNSGFDTTGKAVARATLTADNVLDLNDTLSMGLSGTVHDDRDNRYSDSLTLSWSVPWRNWSFGADFGLGDYAFDVDGVNETFRIDGHSRYWALSAERVLTRGQKHKIFAYGRYLHTKSRSSIDDIEIKSQRRRLNIGSLGVRGEHFLQGGSLAWDVALRKGFDIFDTEILDDSIVDPEFSLLSVQVDLNKRLGQSAWTYSGRLAGQFADSDALPVLGVSGSQALPSSEQFSIGSWSTVRGFHDDSMFGSTGAYLRNTLRRDLPSIGGADVSGWAGLDVGWVKSDRLRSWSQDYIAGASLGVDITLRSNLQLSAAVAHALSRPDDNEPNSESAFEADRTIFFIGLTQVF